MEKEIYVVQEGDTIISVAQLYGIKVIDLIKANNLEDVYYLTPGEELIIPTESPLGFTYYVVQKGDTLYNIAKEHNISVNDLVEINGIENANYIYPGEKILVPKEGVYAYITKENDTIVNVANSLGVPLEDILSFNKRIFLLPDQLIAYKVRDTE